MSITSKSIIINWFKTGLKPLETQFTAWLNSYWHKHESIPESSVTGLTGALAGKQNSLGFTPENIANKGAVNGYASLNASGQIPSGQLPSFVDDVLEFASLAAFPVSGETGKIYVAIDTNLSYRWSGSVYVLISSVPADATEAVKGIIELATQAETDAGTDDVRAITPRKMFDFVIPEIRRKLFISAT